MTADDDSEHRAQLRRLAFGRTNSPSEQQRADEALLQWQQLQADDVRRLESLRDEHGTSLDADAARRDVSGTSPDARAEVDVGSGADSGGDGIGDANANASRSSVFDRSSSVFDRPLSAFPRWLVPTVVIGLIAVGALVGIGVSGVAAGSLTAEGLSATSSPHPMRSSETSTSAGDVPGLPPIPPVGDVDAALRWFTDEQTPEDLMPLLMDGMDPGTTRLALHSPGEDPWDVWVSRNLEDGGFCLAVSHSLTGMAGSSCTSPETFLQTGLSVTNTPAPGSGTEVHVSWDGRGVTATRNR